MGFKEPTIVISWDLIQQKWWKTRGKYDGIFMGYSWTFDSYPPVSSNIACLGNPWTAQRFMAGKMEIYVELSSAAFNVHIIERFCLPTGFKTTIKYGYIYYKPQRDHPQARYKPTWPSMGHHLCGYMNTNWSNFVRWFIYIYIYIYIYRTSILGDIQKLNFKGRKFSGWYLFIPPLG